MRLRKEFITHEIDGKQYMISLDEDLFPGMAQSNRTAACIIDLLKDETSEDELVERMLERFSVPRSVIEEDVARTIGILRRMNAVE